LKLNKISNPFDKKKKNNKEEEGEEKAWGKHRSEN